MTGTNAANPAPVQFSIVSAVYNVARYLDEFIDAIEAQTVPRSQFEVVAVDDGSTDDSLARLREWEQRRPGLVRVLTKENGGQSTARNAGLEIATGRWVTFTDPDDRIAPDYLARVAAFLERHPGTDLVATNRLMLDDASGEVTDSHPLRRHFEGGDQLRRLDVFTQHFHGSAPSAFFRTDRLREEGIRFDPAVRPNFEDGHFCVNYLLADPAPRVGFLASAQYIYRKRQDSSSTLQTSLGNPDRYTSAVRNGYLDVLRRAAERYGRVPEWLQNYIVYELSWYLSSQERHAGAVTAAVGPVADEFHGLVREITTYLEPEVIKTFDMREMRPLWRDILLHSWADEPWCADHVVVDRHDPDQKLVRLVYRFTGDQPDERIFLGGEQADPVHAKIRDLEYHDRVLIRERIMWVPSDRVLRVSLDGRFVELRFNQRFPVATTLSPLAIRLRKPNARPGRSPAGGGRRGLLGKVKRRAFRELSRNTVVGRPFRDSWVLVDRIHDADDSGERLFRHLRDHRPDINAWFVIEKGTPDWRRLRADGYGRRVVPHGGLRWRVLMLNCRHLVSSHADVPVVRPPEILRLAEPQWRFTFLQHGVIKDDLSTWLNHKDISIFVTSTPQEQASIAGDHTGYVHTTKEAKMTGLPRFDRLLELGGRFPEEKRDLILVAPTWRNWLVPPLEAGSQRRVLNDDFYQSDFHQQWMRLLRSEEVAETCRRHGLTVGFLPHPNLQALLPGLDLPPHVQPLSFAGADVQEYFARAAVLVTDYSSMAFNAAYIERPVVYFQFDADRVLGGEHIGRGGYFDYERDGFGPVTSTVESTTKEIDVLLSQGRSTSGVYHERVQATFPQRDGRCCERITEEILASTRPMGTRAG